MGCPTGKECLPSNYPTQSCENQCPDICDLGHISCKLSDPNTGCILGSACLPVHDDKGCENKCAPQCKAGNQLCTHFDSRGCKVNQVCIAPSDPCTSAFNEKGCQTNFDPECTPGKRLCPGGSDNQGCRMPGTCTPANEPCPPNCNQSHEKNCWRGRYQENDLGHFCVDAAAYSSLWNNVECQTHCPAACEWSSEKACAGGKDPLTGCPLPDECGDIAHRCHELTEGSCFGEHGEDYSIYDCKLPHFTQKGTFKVLFIFSSVSRRCDMV